MADKIAHGDALGERPNTKAQVSAAGQEKLTAGKECDGRAPANVTSQALHNVARARVKHTQIASRGRGAGGKRCNHGRIGARKWHGACGNGREAALLVQLRPTMRWRVYSASRARRRAFHAQLRHPALASEQRHPKRGIVRVQRVLAESQNRRGIKRNGGKLLFSEMDEVQK